MTFIAQPLDVISAPNFFAPQESWKITVPNAVTLWFQLIISDSLGERRYIAASGSALSVIFQRADLISNSVSFGVPTNTAQSITKIAAFNTSDRSMLSFALTADESTKILSGTVKFQLVESGTTTVWVQNHLISRQLTSPGF